MAGILYFKCEIRILGSKSMVAFPTGQTHGYPCHSWTALRDLLNTPSIMRASPPLISISTFPKSSLACSIGRFPTEILQQIITFVLGQYLTDILLDPESTRSWDAIGTLLHINHCLRCCALKVLNALWEGTFVERKTGCVSVSPLKDLAHSSGGCVWRWSVLKGFRVTTYTRSNTCVASPNSHVPIPMRSFPRRGTFFPCARRRRRTNDSADPLLCT